MIYSYEDYLALELMTDDEILKEILNAQEIYVEYHAMYINSSEDDESSGAKIPLSIIIDNLKNIESYMRKAGNLLHNYDNNIMTKTYIENRKKYFKKDNINQIKNRLKKRGRR